MTPRLCCLVTAQEPRADRWTRSLRAEGWRVERCATPAAVRLPVSARGSVVLVDLGLVRPRPAAALSRLRARLPGWRVALVAEASEAFDPRLNEALGSGADDVIPAGLEGGALASRLERLAGGTSPELRTGDGKLRLDRDRRQAWACLRRPRLLRLTRTEFDLLAALLERRGRVLSRNELIALVWPGAEINGETVARHIGSLRRKLAGLAGRIRTAHGTGYAAG